MKESNHQDWVAAVFDRASATYNTSGSYFVDFGIKLVDLMQVEAGSSVLDIACGSGAQLIPLAKKLGKNGQLFGIDISKSMLEVASKELAKQGIQATLLQMDAENLEFESEMFDAITCGSALYFFPHPEKALSEAHRVLKSKGKLGMSLFGRGDPRYSFMRERAESLGATKSLMVNRFANSQDITDAFKQAGFSSIQIIQDAHTHYFETLDDWWQSLWVNATRALFEQLTQRSLEQLKAEMFDLMKPSREPKGLPNTYNMIYVLAS